VTDTQTVRLDSIAEVRLGRQRSPKHHSGSHMRPYVRAANVSWDGLLLDDIKEMNFTDEEMAVYGLQPGDLLLNEASGSAREVGKPAIWGAEIDGCAFQNTLIRVRPRGADARYLLQYFRFQAETGRFALQSRGVGIHHLGQQTLAAWPVPLPSIEEQRRIAAVLDEADELRAKRRASLALLDSLTESLFIDMFGDPLSNPRGYPFVRLADVCVGKGEYGAGVASEPWCADKPRYLRITDIQADGRLNEDRVCPAGRPADWRTKHLRAGDIVFARSGATVGKTYLARADDEPMVFAGYLIRFEPNQSVVAPEYIYAFTRTRAYRSWVETSASVVAQPNLNATKYGELLLPLPPLNVQESFVQVARSVERQRTSLDVSGAHADRLFASLQHRAFAGEL
jgi:type I restriction enzyme S subunit